MYPTFHLGPLDFPAYFTLLTVGYLIVVILAWRETFRMEGVHPNKLLDLSIVVLIAGLLGARILHVLADGYFQDYLNLCLDPMQVPGKELPGGVACMSDEQCVGARVGELCNLEAGTCHPAGDCFRAFKVWYGGLAFYGGLIVAMPVSIWYILRNRKTLTLWRVADLAGFGIPLGLVFGRLGCWLAGCCFGRETGLSWGITYPRGSFAHLYQIESGQSILGVLHGVGPVHPIPIYEILAGVLLAAVAVAMLRRKMRDGSALAAVVGGYALVRLLIEPLRAPEPGGAPAWMDPVLFLTVALAALLWGLGTQLAERRHLGGRVATV